MIGPPVAMPWMRLAPFVGLWLTPWVVSEWFRGFFKWFRGFLKMVSWADTARRHFSFVLQLPNHERGDVSSITEGPGIRLECLFWVQRRNIRCEQMTSVKPPKADSGRT